MLVYILCGIIVLLIVLYNYAIYKMALERERLLDRIMAKSLPEYKAFTNPPPMPDPESIVNTESNNVVDSPQYTVDNGISSEEIIKAQSAYQSLIR